MPVPWLVVLQSVPWTEVLRNAPKVAEGAKKLWNTVNKKGPVSEVPAEPPAVSLSPESRAIAELQARVAAMEAAAADLHAQMLASSELISTLAEQNTQLIARIESNRTRVLWLAGATAVLAVIVVAGLMQALMR